MSAYSRASVHPNTELFDPSPLSCCIINAQLFTLHGGRRGRGHAWDLNCISWHAANGFPLVPGAGIDGCALPLIAPYWDRLLLCFWKAVNSSLCCFSSWSSSCRVCLITNLYQLPAITEMLFPLFSTSFFWWILKSVSSALLEFCFSHSAFLHLKCEMSSF